MNNQATEEISKSGVDIIHLKWRPSEQVQNTRKGNKNLSYHQVSFGLKLLIKYSFKTQALNFLSMAFRTGYKQTQKTVKKKTVKTTQLLSCKLHVFKLLCDKLCHYRS